MNFTHKIATGFKHATAETLLEMPTAVHVKTFTQDAVKLFAEEFSAATATRQPVIPVIIDSYGGSVYGCLAMQDIITRSDKPVATICSGVAMSAGAYLLAQGTPGYRYCSPTGTIMVHGASAFTMGKLKDMVNSVEEYKRLGKLLWKRLNKSCGQDKKFFQQLIKENDNADLFYTSKQAKAIGIIDHIGTPSMLIKAEINYEWKE